MMHMDPDEIDPSDYPDKEFCSNGSCLATAVERCTQCDHQPIFCKPCSNRHAFLTEHIMEAYTPHPGFKIPDEY